jgi:hypothetical protein
MNRTARLLAALTAALVVAIGATPLALANGGQLKLIVLDQESGKPIPCRMHLKPATGGKLRSQKGLLHWADHFIVPGEVKLRLPRGHYLFEIERGPEYVNVTGHFQMDDHADDEKTVTLRRAVNMAAEGWWSADLHVHRPARDIQLLMQAEDLHVAGLVRKHGEKPPTAPDPESPVNFADDRAFYFWSTEDERAGNAWLLFAHNGALLPSSLAEHSPLAFLEAARREHQAWIDAALPFAADLPIALALGLVDSIQLANDHLGRDKVANTEGEGYQRDARKLAPPFGNALWSQQIYYHVLNAGLRVPPTAGSGSGVSNNPVGYNRVYAYVGEQLDFDTWRQALAAGQVMVTNGPLLRPNVRGQLPGSVFDAPAGEQLLLDVTLSLSTRDPLSYLEIIKNGEVERSVPLREWAKTGTLDALSFTESGWFLIRAVTDVENTYRFASTGPYYVEIGGAQPRVSKASAQFFLDWTIARAEAVKSSPAYKGANLDAYQQAITFWRQRVATATAP